MFVLREVFETSYDEIADVMGKTPAAVRQVAHRAREHIAARRPRMQVDRAQQQVVVEMFMAAIAASDVQGLMKVLAPDVVAIADGGGVAPAARKPITGAERVAAFLARAAAVSDLVVTRSCINGMPGVRIDVGGLTFAVSLAVEDGRITRVYAIANPHKLGWLEKVAELQR